MTVPPNGGEGPLLDHVRVLARYGRWIAALVIGVAIGSYVAEAGHADAYRAIAMVRLVVPEVATSGSSARESADLLAASYVEASRDESFAQRMRSAGADLTVRQVQRRVKVAQRDVPGFLSVTATAGSAQDAAALADQGATALLGLIRDQQDQVVAAALGPLRDRLADVSRSLADPALDDGQRSVLSAEAAQLRTSLAEQEQRLRPTVLAPEPAAQPRSPYSPAPGRRALTMALLAFVVSTEGIVLVRWLRGRLPLGDPAGELGRLTGAPVLELGAVRRRRAPAPVLPFVLQHLGGHEVVTVVQQSGPPTALAGSVVADALSRAGSRVLLIDADARRPRLHAELDVPLSPGVVEVLTGTGRLPDAVHPSPTGSGVAVLSAGSASGPADLATVANGGLAALVRHAGADVSVIVTTTATSPDDALLVVHQFPAAVVLCVDARTARRSDVAESVRVVRSIGGEIVGTICLHSPPRGWRTGRRHAA